MPDWRVIQGDVLERLGELPDESVHCVVTSPPYWGLRDYGVEGQLGLEKTPEEYVETMVAIFREVRRVLRKDGTLWLNMGDCYASTPPGNKAKGLEKWATSGLHGAVTSARYAETLDKSVGQKRNTVVSGLKPKDLVGMPWRLAFALQADGWWLRCDIIWSKPNPMPESVTDRPTKAHEYLFLLTKSARYYYDADALRQPHKAISLKRTESGLHQKHPPDVGVGIPPMDTDRMGERFCNPAGRNKRSVWEIATQPYKGAHFATFPEKLVEPCVRAGTGEEGCCPMCGASFTRMVAVDYANPGNRTTNGPRSEENRAQTAGFDKRLERMAETTGWKPGCDCNAGTPNVHVPPPPTACTVLDPFCGSGTTGAVALRLGRSFVGIELNAEYCKLARKRIGAAAPLFAKEAPP